MKAKHILRLSLGVLVLMVGIGILTPIQAQEPDDPTSDLSHDVVDPFAALEGQSALVVSQISATDPDGDGLTTTEETALGTDPNNVDSDCDYEDDKTEVGNPASPTNTDGDSIIDALESTLADADGDTTNDEADSDTTSPQVSCGRFIPFAIKLDNSETTQLEVRITGGTNVTAVAVKVTSFFASQILKLDGAAIAQNDFISLFDDGTHGDRRANDGIWSRNGISADAALSGATTVSVDTLKVTDNGVDQEFQIKLKASNGQFWPYGIELALVPAASVQQTPVMVNANLQTVSNLANIIDPLNSLLVKKRSLQTVSKRFYQDFSDDYDFVFFFADSQVSDGPVGQFQSAKNETQNIGAGIFDNTAAFGSQGKLQGSMFLNFGSNGPTLHEVMHNWAAFGLSGLGFHQCIGNGHWGIVGVGKGQLGGFDGTTLVDNMNGTYTVDSFGTFANGGDSVNYAPLELYLAGLADAGAVADIKVPVNANCNIDYSVPGKATFSADSINTVTIAQIQTELGGPRNPSFAASQKNFKTAMVIMSQYKLNATEMAFFNDWSKIFGDDLASSLKSFKEATGNAGTMDTKMPVEKLVAVDKTLATTPVISPSAEITYTITMTNGTGADLTNLTVSDNIPAKTSYVAGSATANPAIVTLTNFPATTPGFTLTNNSSVAITYRLKVTDTATTGDILTNIATISAPTFMQALTDSVTVTVGGNQSTAIYLPLIIKN